MSDNFADWLFNVDHPELQIGKRGQNTRAVHYPYRKAQLEGVVIVVVAITTAILFADMGAQSIILRSRHINRIVMPKNESIYGATVKRAIGGSEASINISCLWHIPRRYGSIAVVFFWFGNLITVKSIVLHFRDRRCPKFYHFYYWMSFTCANQEAFHPILTAGLNPSLISWMG